MGFGDIALGCEQLGGSDWGDYDLSGPREAVRCALDLGVTVFDTADVYGLGQGEEELSKALGSHRHDVTVITKGGVRWSESGHRSRARTWRDSSAKYLSSAIDASLRRLRLDVIPLYLVHWPDMNTTLDETLDCLAMARDSGKVRHYGLSNFSASLVKSALHLGGISAVETELNLLSRSDEIIELRNHKDAGLETLSYGVLAQGLLTGKYFAESSFGTKDRRHRLEHFRPEAFVRNEPVYNALRDIALETGRTQAQVAIRWVLESGAVSCAILGAKSPKQLESNLDIKDWRLDEDMLGLLRAAREKMESDQEVQKS
mgnify:CR=1 FL=1|tara:strand:- start:10988 stop:11935 length:948 start_codon:yes stop_codon:yes gene_type:complete